MSPARSGRAGAAAVLLGALGIASAGCYETIAVLGAMYPAVEQHEEAWRLPAPAPIPGECVHGRPRLVWGTRSSPSTAPLEPIDVRALSMKVRTPMTCEAIATPGGHGYVVRGLGEGRCEIDVDYVHPVTGQAVHQLWPLEFHPERVPNPLEPTPERGNELVCERVLEAANRADPAAPAEDRSAQR